MIAATWPRDEPLEARLLFVDSPAGVFRDGHVRDLPERLRAGDLVVVNDAATIPASFSAVTRRGQVELRLAAELGDSRWRGVLFGAGDWRTRTEDRAPPPAPDPGDELRISPELVATLEKVDRRTPRLVVVRFAARGAALWQALYRLGRPVQYAHVERPLEVWHLQTPFASRPWSAETPSAGRFFTWSLLGSLGRRGVRVAALTHAAGLSSTGDAAVDALLPLPERFDLPAATVRAVGLARAERRRVVAVGTTVVRALEGCAARNGGELVAGEGMTDLHIDARFRPRIVDTVLTGLHEVGSSHRELLRAFVAEPLLTRALAHAEESGYLGHEFGDAMVAGSGL
jgi:S-adenosylmethionine:tRNA ribosyltransferase-isomerase